jgi:hypothetical protein
MTIGADDDRARPFARIALIGVLLVGSTVYAWNLGKAPVYLGWDEARTAMQGYSLATTGRDMNGNRSPLFFHITDPLIRNHSSGTWWQPMLFYLTAAALSVAPIAQWSVRLPNVALAVLNMWIIATVARRLFGNRWYGVLAALMLALTPAHFFFARLAQDYFLPQTFVLLWLWCLVRYLDTARAWLPAAAGFVLGLGLYTHISSWIVMPFYLAVTSVVLWVAHKPLRAGLALHAGFAVTMLPLLAWLWFHPTLLTDMFHNYQVVTALNGAERVALYWDYFNPSYLFFSGGADPMWATRQAGVFLLAFAVLLPLGIWNIWREHLSIPRALLLLGFLFAPVPIVATLPEAPRYATARELLVVPFGVLIGVAGVEFLVQRRTSLDRPGLPSFRAATTSFDRASRVVAALLLLSLPIQFASYARDYFTDYQLRSSFRHDSLNVRGVVEHMIASDATRRVPAVYLDEDLGAGKAVQLMFHLITHQRPDLWARTRHFSFSTFDPNRIPSGSLLVLASNDPRIAELVGGGECTVIDRVYDVTDSPSAAILRRR